MKNAKIECRVTVNEKADISAAKASMQFKTIGQYLYFCHQTVGKLISIAKNEGIEYQDISEAIDEMFECQATEDSLKMFFEQFAEKTKEEAK